MRARAVGIAEDEAESAGAGGGAEHLESVVGVLAEAVEEVLGVEGDVFVEGAEELDGVGDHRQVLFVARLQSDAHLIGAGLADERDRGGGGIDEALDVGVRCGR